MILSRVRPSDDRAPVRVLETRLVNRSDELDRLLESIEVAAQRFVGVNEYEDLLVDLLALLRSDDLPRETAVAALTRLAVGWPWGAVEALEFSLRSLRWDELRHVLEAQRKENPDFRCRALAGQVLEVYAEAWPGGDIYRTYRLDKS